MLLSLQKSSHVGVVCAQGFFPPIIGRWLPLTGGKRIDAIHGTGFETLVTARAKLRKNNDVDTVVENGTEIGWTSSQTRIAIYAL